MKVWTSTLCFAASLLVVAGASAQSLVTEIKLRTDPEDARVRPLEHVVIQVVMYGEVSQADGSGEQVRLREAGARLEIKDANGGWLSKPFRFQGEEEDPFYEKPDVGLGALILGRATTQFALQDAVLYTAPERPGKYEVEATLNDKTTSVTIQVDADAPSRTPSEEISFPAERRHTDAHRRLAEHYAPFVAQETWFQPKSDYLARFDFDGDWEGDNNWEQTPIGASQAYVHYAVMETSTHWFLIYNFFHPRDYSDKCVAGTCHENDNEGLILTVEKDGSPHGRLLVMETLAHNNIYSYLHDTRIRGNLHRPDGDLELHEGSHPVVFIESGGHGVYGSTDAHGRYSLARDAFEIGTGVTYMYKGVAERPRHPNDRNVGYELLSIYDHWWVRAHQGNRNRSFDDYYVYEPYGNRPRTQVDQIAGAFLGVQFGANKAKPFWGWHDRRGQQKRVLATGQWGLDPAYAVSQNLSMPDPFSLDYTFNPFLGVGRVTPSPPPAQPLPSRNQISRGAVSRSDASGGFLEARPKDEGEGQGRFDLRLLIDGTADVYIQGATIRYEALSGRPPVDEGSEYTQPIPRAALRDFSLSQEDGRGEVELLEKPSEENSFTAKVRFADPKSGDDHYRVRLEWEAEMASSPAPRRGGILSRHIEVLDEAGAPKGTEIFSDQNDPSRYDNDDDGEFEFRGRIDGTVILRVQGGRVFAENVSGRPVEVDDFEFSQPLPQLRVKQIELERKDGRGDIVLLERPWEENGFQAVIQVSDPKGGDDRYRFTLKWKR